FHSSHTSGSSADEGTGVSPGVPNVPTYRSEDEQISWKSSDDEVSESKDDDNNADNEDDDGQDDDSNLRVQTPSHFESTDDEIYDEVTQGDNVEGEELDEEETNEEEEVNELYRDLNINLKGRDTKMTDALLANVQTTQVIEDTHVIITTVTPEVQQQSSSVSSGFISNMLNPYPDTCIDSILNLNTELTSLVDVPVTTNIEMPHSSVTTLLPPHIPYCQPQQLTPFSTPTIVPNRLRDEAQAKNEDLINKLDENIKKIIKKQVKVQVKEQVTKILPRIEKLVNEQLEAKVVIRYSNEAKKSYVVAANLSELELKKIVIDKMKNNKSIDRSVPQKNLYKALVDAYESDKDILASYGDTVTLKRRRYDEDEDKVPSAGSNRGSKRKRAGKKPKSTSAPKKKTSKSTGKSKEGSKLIKRLLATQNEDPRESFNELMNTPLDFSAFMLNWLKVDTPTLELLAGPTFELMKGSCKSLPLPLIPNSRGHRVIPFDHFINNDLAYLSGGVSSRTYATSVTKTKAADYGHIKWIEDLVPNTMWSQVLIVYDKHALWGISYWGRKCEQFYGFTHNYKHLEWITVRRDDDKRYTFKEGDYNRRLQDIEDMLLFLVQGKLTNLNIEERLALGVSL
ncbi:hypothetical protein Tco_0578523, partial [Tanacetum coccineum]